ncbi:MAG: 30S ribosomal protein S27ae [Methanomicrobiales archaeon]|nr:30S ribosomal protein S27ae [Methanomicrobiales archaeon]
MAAKKVKGSASPRRGSYYTISGSKATLTKKFCPRCGPGIILAEHEDRVACGRCRYTEFKK